MISGREYNVMSAGFDFLKSEKSNVTRHKSKMPTEFTITIHMVSSLDGFIAKKDGDVSWFESTSPYDKGVDPQNTEAFMKTIDCFIMGSRTYEHAVELSANYGWAYGDVPTFVLSHRNLPIHKDNIQIYAGDLNTFVNERLKPVYKNCWVVGGAALALDFINLKLADDIRLSILPIILGDGTRFLDHTKQEQGLHLKDVLPYKSGMVELWYQLKK
jgi:dihydrofolate reductase